MTIIDGPRSLTIDEAGVRASAGWVRAESGTILSPQEWTRLAVALTRLEGKSAGDARWESDDGGIELVLATGKRDDVAITGTICGGDDLRDRLTLLLMVPRSELTRLQEFATKKGRAPAVGDPAK